MTDEETIITPAQIETLEKLKSLPLETDEDYAHLDEIFPEDE
jgi:hypothetical protein